MVKSVIKIAGYMAEYFTADQIWLICAGLKLTGYRSKSKDEAMRIISISKNHVDCYEYVGISNDKPSGDKPPAKTKNCIIRLVNVLFSEEISAKFIRLDNKKDKNVLDSGLAANDEYFWQEVHERRSP